MAQQQQNQRQDSDRSFADMDGKSREMSNKDTNAGSFADNPDRAREAGKEGGSR